MICAVERDSVRTFSSSIRQGLRGGVPLRQRRRQRLLGGHFRIIGEARGLVPFAALALGHGSIAQLDRLADPIRREQPRALLGRLLDQAQGFRQRTIGIGDGSDRDLELDAGVDVPDREIVQAQDLRPQVGVTEMLGG